MENYQIEKMSEFRTRRVFSLVPFLFVNGLHLEEVKGANGFVWTGKWFSFTEITEQRVRERYLEFNDGWSYQNYWGAWEETWKFVKINN